MYFYYITKLYAIFGNAQKKLSVVANVMFALMFIHLYVQRLIHNFLKISRLFIWETISYLGLRKKSHRSYAPFLKLAIIVLSITISFGGYSQQLNNNVYSYRDNWVANFNLGFSQFYGDASNSGYFKKFNGQIGFTTGVSARKMFLPPVGAGLNIQYAGLKSTKLFNGVGQAVNIELTGGLFDFNMFGYLDFNTLFWGYKPERKFSVYSTLGLGVAFWNSTLSDYDSGYVFQSGHSYRGVNYKSAGLVVPVGMGMNIKLGTNWALNIEGNLTTVLNDDVDVWRDGFSMDQSFLTTVGISYYINYKFKSKKKKPCGCDKAFSKPLEPASSFSYSRITPEMPVQKSIKPTAVIKQKPILNDNDKSTQGVVFRVQILAKRTKLPNLTLFKKKYGIVDDVHENYQDGVYRYSIGYFRNYQDALNYSRVIRNKGVFDAFVVVYKDNIRIALTPELKKFSSD